MSNGTDLAQIIQSGFLTYRATFQAITARAAQRFATRDWHAAHADAVERLNLYRKVVDQVVANLRADEDFQPHNRAVWQTMKKAYAAWIVACDDFELAETFFNSITRRVLGTAGVDVAIEFSGDDFEAPPVITPRTVHVRYPVVAGDLRAVLYHILQEYSWDAPYCDIDRTADRLAAHLALQTDRLCEQPILAIELLTPVFYRGQGAYLVGRLFSANGNLPLAIAFYHGEAGIDVDAVLTTDDQVSILFSFTRAYFHVAVERPYELVHYLKTIMHWKRLAELYISIGFNKHGKTEFYRDLIRHLAQSEDRFVIAPGQRGMVMVVFTLPSYDIVFKLIKDHFAEPKRTSRAEVMQHYDLVFNHDRAGRLIDAQEFEGLSFERARFDPALLEELLAVAGSIVRVQGEQVVIRHLYIERRLTPLDLYVRQAGDLDAEAAVIDYGQAIKDLAAANIFPGDVLLKNFGVTRHGRVVFYDYDELCQVTECYFRGLPQARSFSDEFEAEPWFYVGKNDIFPEEFRTFMGLTGRLREVFVEHHADLFSVEFWRGLKKRHKAGEIIDILPYRQGERLS